MTPGAAASAERDYEWWFCARDAALGEHGSGFDGSPSSWDEEMVWRCFEKLINPRVRFAVWTYARVHAIMGAIGPAHREVAGWIYEPRNYHPLLRLAFPLERTSPGTLTLAGAALRTRALSSAFERAHGGKTAASTMDLGGWVETQAQAIAKLPKWVSAANEEAEAMRQGVLEAYVGAVRMAREAQREAERAEVAALRRVFA